MKNTIKYDNPYLRHVDIARLLKDADKAFDNEQMLDLSKDELYNIMAKRPRVKGSKVMDVLIKWAKKRFALEALKVEKKEEVVEKEEKKVEEVTDVEMAEEKKDGEKKEEEKKEDTKKEEEKTEETKRTM